MSAQADKSICISCHIDLTKERLDISLVAIHKILWSCFDKLSMTGNQCRPEPVEGWRWLKICTHFGHGSAPSVPFRDSTRLK